MTKKELIKAVSEKVGFTQKDITAVYDTSIETIIATLSNGEEVNISGFGKFVAVQKEARDMRNPLNGQIVHVEAKKAPKFKAASALKEALK